MYGLVKFLSLLVYPLGLSMVLLASALLLLVFHRRRAGLIALAGSVIVLWAFASAVVADGLVRSLEAEWPDRPVEAMPEADAVVVMGGAFSSGNGRWVYPDAGGNVDRYWHAARIFHAGKAPRIILSGGRAPHLTHGRSEAESGALFLQDLGVPADALLLDREALTTRENALNIQAIVAERGLESLLVVTSASHMRRSMAALALVDAELIPAATDFTAQPAPGFSIRRYIPSASALSRSTRAIHELVGLAYYRSRGWI